MIENDSMDDGQRINHLHLENFQEADVASRNNGDLRNLHFNNPFGRTFIIINDVENG